jgi:hypothetical protein
MTVARLYKVGTPYNGVDLDELDFEQSADVMYLAHLNYAPTKLVRAGHTDWSFVTLTFGPTNAAPTGVSATATTGNTVVSGDSYFPRTPSYCVTAIDAATGQESRASATVTATTDLSLKKNYITINWSAVAGADRYRVFKANDGSLDFGYIGSTPNTSFQDVNIGPDYTDGPPIGENPFGGAGNYPSTVSFFEQRLVWGRTKAKPNGVWASRSGDYENMDTSRPLKADDALSFALVAGRVNSVNQLASVDNLLAMTSDAIFKVTGGQEDYLTPTNITTRRQNGRGCARLGPLIVDTVAFYKQSVGSAVRAIGYSFEKDGYPTNDVTIFSPHLFTGFDIKGWAYAQEPRSLIWAVRSDGRLLCFTWEEEQQVWGWTLCETDGLVESVAVISENGEDRLYLTVWRTIGGAERLFIERMASAKWEDQADCCFADCARSYSFDTPQALLTNLWHLEGRSVAVLADAKVVSGLVVSGGRVTLPFEASKATVGLPYDALIETLPLAMQTNTGWTIAKPQQAAKAIVRVVNTRGIQVGPSEDQLETPKPRFNEDLGDPNALKTGNIEVTLPPRTTGGVQVVVKSSDPLPMLVTGVYYDPHVKG